MAGFCGGGDACLSIFQAVAEAGGFALPRNATVLEIGCAEADWITPMLAARPDLQITGIDWRRTKRPGTIIQGDVLTHDFPAASFDVVVGISSIEHIGLGHYEGDPLDDEGDRHCMARVVTWLKPGGWVYLDVPYQAHGYQVHGTAHRAYDDRALQDRLIVPGLTQRGQWWATSAGVLCAPGPDAFYTALVLQR